VVLFLGRINKKKGLDILVRAFAHVRAQAVLVVVGDDDDGHLRPVKSIARELGLTERVFFVGPLEGERVFEAYADASVFALTCRTDTFPMTIVEACAAGVPVVVADTCEIAELVHGRAGLAVPLDETAIAAAIERVLGDPVLHQRFATGARQLAQSEFSVRAVVDKLESVYKRAVKG
jgi:glycosyltransferase involved in cell wall biosynthesis